MSDDRICPSVEAVQLSFVAIWAVVPSEYSTSLIKGPPWDIHLVGLGKDGDEPTEVADRLHAQLRQTVRVVYDDRDAGPGEKLTDAELLGCPLRITVGRKGLAAGVVEAQARRSGAESQLALAEAAAGALELLDGLD